MKQEQVSMEQEQAIMEQNQTSMTAKVSAFSRAYHASNNDVKVFDDFLARRLLGEEDYQTISESMVQGIAFFNPSFEGTAQEGLRWIVDNQLSPAVLERTVFTEALLEEAVEAGISQYLILASGYDTFAYRQPEWAKRLQIFELDQQAMIDSKAMRLHVASIGIPLNVRSLPVDLSQGEWATDLYADQTFDDHATSFCSLLGLLYYLREDTFEKMLASLRRLLSDGSYLVFDYPVASTGEQAQKQAALAQESGEGMVASYSFEEVEALLADAGFSTIVHLVPNDITKKYFDAYNEANPSHPMVAFDNVNLCCAIRTGAFEGS